MAVSKLATKYQFEDFGAVRWNSREGTKITTVVVHHAAMTNFDAMPGIWATREASAHYGIGQNGEIRAYVDEDKRAWHCGNGNSYSIGIECTNTTGDPEWGVSDKTVDSLVELIKEIESRLGKMIIVAHKDVPGNATACCGPSLYPRLQEIRDRVNNNQNTGNSTGYQIAVCNKQVQTTDVLNVRSSPTSQSKQVASLPAGKVVTATKICTNGESINGNSTWYEQNSYGWISSAYVKEVSAPSNSGLVSKSGTFIPDRRLPVSGDTTVESPALAHYEAGQTINYDSYIMSNGYAWISYIGGSGNRRYVAVGPDDGRTDTTWGSGFFN